MRAIGGFIALIVVALAGSFIYKSYFTSLQASGAASPQQAIDGVGAQNDILAIAQAERAYQAEHGSYVSLSELNSSGALTIPKNGRAGYSYDVQTSDSTFRVTAQCAPAANSPCTNYTVDETMQVRPGP
jgi:hypothetical protein